MDRSVAREAKSVSCPLPRRLAGNIALVVVPGVGVQFPVSVLLLPYVPRSNSHERRHNRGIP
jgi:hypothetical protein